MRIRSAPSSPWLRMFILAAVLIFSVSSLAFAETVTVEAFGKYPLALNSVSRASDWDTDQDGIPDEWEDANGLDKNNAAEKGAEFIENLVKNGSNGKLTKDRIRTIAAALIKVQERSFSYEKDDSDGIMAVCRIVAEADLDAIDITAIK